jgi:ankyrin repeat protein
MSKNRVLSSLGKSLSPQESRIISAIQSNQVEVLDKIVNSEGYDNIEGFRDKDGWNLLQIAAQSSSKSVVEYLFGNFKFEIDDSNQGKGTVLHLSILNSCFGLVKFFLENGADPLLKNKGGHSALDIAVFKKSNRMIQEISKYIEKQGTEEEEKKPEIQIIESRKVRAPSFHSDWKIGTSVEREEQLLIAIARGDKEMVFKLNELKVSFICENSSGDRPLHLACQKGDLEMVKYLIQEKGVSRQPLNNFKWSPLHIACINGSLSLIKYLVEEAYLETNTRDINLKTPIDLCTNPKAIKFLTDESERLENLRKADMSDICSMCGAALSYKFGDCLANIPTCSIDERSNSVSANVRYVVEINSNHEMIRPFFDPFEENISIYQIRFGEFKDLFCQNCKKKGKHCRCISEEDETGRLRNPHFPFISTKISMLRVFSKFNSANFISPLQNFKNSSLFDIHLVQMIFQYLGTK